MAGGGESGPSETRQLALTGGPRPWDAMGLPAGPFHRLGAAMNTLKKTDWPRVLLQACKRIERGEQRLSLTALAEDAGVSSSELQRQFKRRLGVSPRAYAQTLQLHRLTQRVTRERS